MKAFLCFVAVVGAVRAGMEPYQAKPSPSYNTSPYTPKYQTPIGYGQEKAKYAGKTGYEPSTYYPTAPYGDSYAKSVPVYSGAQDSHEGEYTKGHHVDGYSGYATDVQYKERQHDYETTPYGGNPSYQKPAMKQSAAYEPYPPTLKKPYQEAYHSYGGNAYAAGDDGSYKKQEQTYPNPPYSTPYNTQPHPSYPAPKPYNTQPYPSYPAPKPYNNPPYSS